MGQSESKPPISNWRLKKIRRYIAKRVPLVPKGYKLTVDETALEGLLPEALQANPAFKELLWNKKDLLSPEKAKQLKSVLLDQFNRAAKNIPFDSSEIENEAAITKRTLVMAGPDKMTFNHGGLERKEQIYLQWHCIRHALVKAGAHLEIISPLDKESGYREVYTRDRYVMIGDTAYLPDPQELQDLSYKGVHWLSEKGAKGYIGEVAQVEKALKERGVKTVTVKGAWFEGGNVVRHFSSRTIFAGIHGAWSSEDSAQRLLAAINETQAEKWKLQPVLLTNYPAMYHMDTGMSEELPNGEVMLSSLVTDKETYQKICDIVGAENVIDLSKDEAARLATNVIDVGDTLVMTGNCKDLREKLTDKGYTVIMPDDYGQSSFEFGLGGVHCMTNDLRQPRRKQKAQRGP